ncbi:MAG: hypothetical protein ACP5GA_08920, partial [Acidithiobacillus sp.]
MRATAIDAAAAGLALALALALVLVLALVHSAPACDDSSMITPGLPLPHSCRVAAEALAMEGSLVLASMQTIWEALDDPARATLSARLDDQVCGHWARVACASPYWRRLLEREPFWILDLDAAPVVLEASAVADTEEEFFRTLRRDRQRAMARI